MRLRIFKRIGISPQKEVFNPVLTFINLFIIGISATGGTGSYIMIGNIVSATGLSSLITILFVTLICFFICLPYAEFAARIPSSGNAYSYIYNSLGEIFAVLTSEILLEYYVIGAGCVARGWGIYTYETLKYCKLNIPSYLINIPIHGISENIASICPLSIFAIIFFSAIMLFGIKDNAIVHHIITIINQITLILSIIIGFFYFKISILLNTPFSNIKQILKNIIFGFYVLIGFDEPSCFFNESVDPQKDIPKSMIGTLIYASGLNTFLMIIFLGTMNIDPSKKENIILIDVFKHVGNNWMPYVIGFGSFIGISSCILGSLMSYPRILLTVTRDGLMPPCFNITTGKDVPIFTILFSFLVAVAFGGFISIEINAEIISLGCLLCYAMVDTGVVIKRYERYEMPCLFYILIVIFWIVSFSMGILIFHFKYNTWIIGSLSGTLIIIALIIYFCFPQEDIPSTYACPFMPFFPLLGCAINLIVIGGIEPSTWILHGILTIVVLVIYFTYGIHNSKVQFEAQESFLINKSYIEVKNSSPENY